MDSLPDEYMRLVGIIAAHWEWAELVLERAVAEVGMHDPDKVGLLTNEISFSSKCDLILAYARPFEDADPPTWKRFTLAIKRLRDAYSLRNAFVHAKWRHDRKTGEWGKSVVRVKGGKLSVYDASVELSELEHAAQETWDAGESFVNLCGEFGVLSPSRDKLAEPPLRPGPNHQT
jgi:hypothetical protein